MAAWSCARAEDGRVYYFKAGDPNPPTWNKPDDYDGPDPPPVEHKYSPEQIDASWAEATDGEGKPYYWNKLTKAVVREPPEALQRHQQNARAAPSFVAGSGFGGEASDQRLVRRDDRRGDHLPQKPSFDGGRAGGTPWENRQDGNGFRGPMPVKTDEPEYATAEQAEDAFMKLLKRHNIAPSTEWKDALRLVIRERDYRAIKDPQERKQLFEKYRFEVRAQEKSKEKERRERMRQDFSQMLLTHEDIKHYTRWKTAKPLIEREAAFKSAGDDVERKQMFDDYILELQRKHADDEIDRHQMAMKELRIFLQNLIVDPDTKWDTALGQITTNERFVSDDNLITLHKLDILNTFDAHVKALDRAANDNRQQDKNLRARRDRQARDAFQDLLRQKVKDGKIRANTKWMDFLPTVANDEPYLAMLRTMGSTPQDLFWDTIEDLEQDLRAKRHLALDVLEEVEFEIKLETRSEQFAKVMASHPKTASIDPVEAQLILDKLQDKVRKRVEDDKHYFERKQRKAAEALRSVIKHLEPPVRLGDTYEDIATKLVDYDEYQTLDDKQRRSAFEKYMDRLQEKEDELERDRAARRDREHRNGSHRAHDRDRGRRHRTRTRSPEADAYEADRRKAQADRERQYRKASFGLTPPPAPPRDRRGDDRYDRDRRPDRHDGVYERERRERELERERNYVSRADPRDKGRTLDYGDDEPVGSRPGSIRKRRESEGSSGSKRDNKRVRQAEAAVVTDDPAIQSGSEEGEIEEV